MIMTIGLLLTARAMAPWPIDEGDARAAQVEVALWVLGDSSSTSAVDVLFDGVPLDFQTLSVIQHAVPGIRLTSQGRRAQSVASVDDIGESQGRIEVMDVRFLAMPLYGLALISVETAACGQEVVLFKLSGRWQMLSRRWLCS